MLVGGFASFALVMASRSREVMVVSLQVHLSPWREVRPHSEPQSECIHHTNSKCEPDPC